MGILGSAKEKLFDRIMLLLRRCRQVHQQSGRLRAAVGSRLQWRLALLGLINRFGVRWFDGLPIVAFAPNVSNQGALYSFRLVADFGSPADYLVRLGRSRKPLALLVGGKDELLYANRFAPLLRPLRPDLR
jgi:hypothetical protein